MDPRLPFELQGWAELAGRVLAKYLPVLVDGASFGMRLQGLEFKGAGAWKLRLWALVDAALPFVAGRASTHLRELLNSLKLLNYLAFITSGSYPTLLHRLLGLRMTPLYTDMASNVDFDYMNRQLAWQALTDLSLLLGPALQRVFSWLRRYHSRSRFVMVLDDGGVGCALCGHPKPAMTSKIQACGHTYCYYCIGMWRVSNHGECPVCTSKYINVL